MAVLKTSVRKQPPAGSRLKQRPTMKILQALTCLLLLYDCVSVKLKVRKLRQENASTEEWCSDNRFPADKKFSAQGLSQFQDVFGDAELADLREILDKDPLWKLGTTWEFKAKVHSDFNEDLAFGFPGGGGFLRFNIPPSADEEEILVVDQVKALADSVELEYRGTSPANLSEFAVDIWDVCLRPRPCSAFSGCLPSYKYRNKQHGTGETLEDCCEPVLCKEELSNGCSPDTKWKPTEDFDTRLGDSLARCCVVQQCSEATCSSTKYKLREGTGLLGSTEEECCDKLFCSDFKGLCNPAHDSSRLPDLMEDGSPRLGSSEFDCCNIFNCTAFDCSNPAGNGLWANRSHPEGIGHSFAHCCDELFCSEVTCDNNTKFGPEASGERQGSTPEVCCKPKLCKDYTCQGASLGIVSPEAFGSTDGECCAERKCEDYTCSSATKWEKKPSVEESEDGGQQPRMGFSDEECCVPKFCKNFLCSSTKWKSRHWPEDDKTLGGSFEECCDALMCSNYTCTTDYDGDGQGTMYVKKKDTNSFRWQGSSDEDCCTPLFCSQYETKFPTKWRRNTAQLGSTDAECYDPAWCSAFNGCGELKLIKDATHKQGSTVQECCEAAKKTD